jgi:hypothetical protein
LNAAPVFAGERFKNESGELTLKYVAEEGKVKLYKSRLNK